MGNLQQLPADMLLEQITNGLVIMLLGMGVVFVFLTLLVFMTKGMSAIARKFNPTVAPATVPQASSVTIGQEANTDGEVAAAIAAAVAQQKRK